MTSLERHQQNTDQAWAEREKWDTHWERWAEWGGPFEAPPRTSPKPLPPPHREQHTVKVVGVMKGIKTARIYSLLAKDRDHAEFMALAQYRGTLADVYWVENKNDGP